MTLNSHTNYKLQKAFNNRSEALEFVIYKEFKEDEEKQAFLLEETLRPHKNIGWNIAVGGEKSYEERFHSKKYNISNEYINEENLENKISISIHEEKLLNKVFRKLFSGLLNPYKRAGQSVVLG